MEKKGGIIYLDIYSTNIDFKVENSKFVNNVEEKGKDMHMFIEYIFEMPTFPDFEGTLFLTYEKSEH